MLDAVHLEERGVPTVTFVTAPFAVAARTHARLQGADDLPFVIVPADYLSAAPGLEDVVVEEVVAKLHR